MIMISREKLFDRTDNYTPINMNCSSEVIDYKATGYFSKMVTDYIASNSLLKPFYEHGVSIDGIKSSIEKRKQFNTDRKELITILNDQYKNVKLSDKQQAYIQQLSDNNTFTICTAHQPNIFTGPLYFIYKILHVIKIADDLQKQLPECKFVPVYYMGSEDADLDELGHININGVKYEWKTDQKGAVGRMKIDRAFIELMEKIKAQLLVYPKGNEVIEMIQKHYLKDVTIEQATFHFVNELFAEYGLIILLPDSSLVKRKFLSVISKELAEEFSHKAVDEIIKIFPSEYKVQAAGRELNLFYLKDDKRERIEKVNSKFKIQNSKFEETEIQKEAKDHPERFSPNVILRPVLQETILPDIAFVGGGGELAYWLELKKVFEAVNVPYPMLILRNSFMSVCTDRFEQAKKLNFKVSDLFKEESLLLNELVTRESLLQLKLEKEKKQLHDLYDQLKKVAGAIDVTLQQHTEALYIQALKKVDALEKKMLRAEKRKYEAQQRQLNKLKSQLFPGGQLQERIDNILVYYAKWGKDFIQNIYDNSLTLEQKFTIIKESC